MPTVLHINTKAAGGGAAHAARSLAQATATLARYQPLFLAGRGRAEDDPHVIRLGVGKLRLTLNVLAFRTLGLDGPLNTRHWQRLWPRIEAADVIHLHNAHGYYLPLPILDRLLRKPVVWTLHDHWLATGRRGFPRPATLPPSRLERLVPSFGAGYPVEWHDRAIRRRAILAEMIERHRPLLVVPTDVMGRELAERGVPPALLRTVPHGLFTDDTVPTAQAKQVARARLGWPADRLVLLFAAAEVNNPVKGWAVLDAALRRLAAPDRFHLVVAGSRHNLVRRLPVPTTCMGPLDRATMRLAYRAADLLVNPTLAESFGLTVIEAQAEATEVLCADLPVLREVAGTAASWFTAGSAAALAATLDAWEPAEPSTLQQQAGDLRRRFDAATAARRYAALYDEVRG